MSLGCRPNITLDMTGSRIGDQHDAVRAKASIPHDRLTSGAHVGRIILSIEWWRQPPGTYARISPNADWARTLICR